MIAAQTSHLYQELAELTTEQSVLTISLHVQEHY
jgi:hypothetical protein